jgi:hypothetical protein
VEAKSIGLAFELEEGRKEGRKGVSKKRTAPVQKKKKKNLTSLF